LKAVQPDDQPENSPIRTDEPGDEEEESLPPPKIEPPYKFKLSSNQKKRSRLGQQQDAAPAAAPAAPAAPTPEPAPAPVEPPVPPKRMRLKRSGQMHEDKGPAAGPSPEDQY
jgi:hypothetical protein